jgi:uncharacterized protein (TIGR02001 family)
MDEDNLMLKNMTTAVLLSAAAFCATVPALAEEEAGPLTLSANANLVTDYRFRGVSLNTENLAFQGGFDLSYAFSDALGFYVGNWNSTLDKDAGFGDMEVDVYAGIKGTAGAIGYKLGAVAYLYPTDASNVDYYELNAEVSGGLGPLALSGGIFVAPSQNNYGGKTGWYLYTTAAYTVPDTGFAVKASLGYEDNAFFPNGKLDWSAGAFYTYDKFTVGAQYVDSSRDVFYGTQNISSGTVVFSLGAAF